MPCLTVIKVLIFIVARASVNKMKNNNAQLQSTFIHVNQYQMKTWLGLSAFTDEYLESNRYHATNLISCSAVILYADWSISVRSGAVHTS